MNTAAVASATLRWLEGRVGTTLIIFWRSKDCWRDKNRPKTLFHIGLEMAIKLHKHRIKI
jgi:hypothetical protein